MKEPCILFIFRFCFFNSQPFAQFGVIHDPFHLVVDDGLGIRLDLVVIALNLFKHDVIPLFILEGVDNRYSLVCLFFGTHSGMVHNNFRMEIFWSIFSPKLSDTAPTKEPCDRLEILEAGIRESNWVLMEVETS